MTIDEPTTLATDYALALLTGWLCILLLRRREGNRARAFWAFAFAALAAAAALGGTWHGFAREMSASVADVLWTATVLCVGAASFAMLAGSALAIGSRRSARILLAFATAKLALYSAWVLVHSEYIYVIVDTAATMLVISALHAWSVARDRDRASAYILGGVVLSAAGAALQASGFALHPRFNHNDAYHVIQAAAMILFFLGARRLHDSRSLVP
jgi:peptidoglycan/LPS O-acetylase OafA/YrhL